MRHLYYDQHGNQISAALALDANGILREGVTQRTPLMLRDAASHRVTDAKGDTDTTAGNRPGWRIMNDAAAREAAHREYLHELTTAWRRGAGKEDVVPDAPKASGNDAMPVSDIETAYRLYAEEISQAWKRPR